MVYEVMAKAWMIAAGVITIVFYGIVQMSCCRHMLTAVAPPRRSAGEEPSSRPRPSRVAEPPGPPIRGGPGPPPSRTVSPPPRTPPAQEQGPLDAFLNWAHGIRTSIGKGLGIPESVQTFGEEPLFGKGSQFTPEGIQVGGEGAFYEPMGYYYDSDSGYFYED